MTDQPVIVRQESGAESLSLGVYRSSGRRVVRSPLDDEDRDPMLPTVEDLVDMDGGAE